VESTRIEYWLTVPAVWSDKAKFDTLSCASQAGFGDVDKIRLVTEPEAAAVHTFAQVSLENRPASGTDSADLPATGQQRQDWRRIHHG
jgi:hypothetical protein